MSDAPQILLNHRLKSLRLPTVLREYGKLAKQAAAEGLDHVQFLARLIELEMIDRERRMIERRIKAAKFPAVKSLDSFDFKAIPALNKMQVLGLARCEWVERREMSSRSAQAALAKPTLLSVSGCPPAKRACPSVLSPRPHSSTN